MHDNAFPSRITLVSLASSTQENRVPPSNDARAVEKNFDAALSQPQQKQGTSIPEGSLELLVSQLPAQDYLQQRLRGDMAASGEQ